LGAPVQLCTHAPDQSRQNGCHRFHTGAGLESDPRSHVNLESKAMNVRPLHDRIIIQRLEEGEQKVGGIIIPDTAKEKPQQGKVIAAGAGKVRDDGTRQRPDVKAGDLILFGKYSGQEIKLDGEEYIIMREEEVLGVLEGGNAKKKK
jgi:chaperonin GroES